MPQPGPYLGGRGPRPWLAELGEPGGQGRDRTAGLAVFSQVRRVQIRPAHFAPVVFALLSSAAVGGPGRGLTPRDQAWLGAVGFVAQGTRWTFLTWRLRKTALTMGGCR
jgi:hypothetical protein